VAVVNTTVRLSAQPGTRCHRHRSLIPLFAQFSLLAPIFPDVAAAKGVGPTMTGFIFSSYSIVTVVASPAIAQMLSSRMVSRMRCLLGGILLVGLSSAAFGTVTHIDDTDTFIVVCLSLRFLLGAADHA